MERFSELEIEAELFERDRYHFCATAFAQFLASLSHEVRRRPLLPLALQLFGREPLLENTGHLFWLQSELVADLFGAKAVAVLLHQRDHLLERLADVLCRTAGEAAGGAGVLSGGRSACSQSTAAIADGATTTEQFLKGSTLEGVQDRRGEVLCDFLKA